MKIFKEMFTQIIQPLSAQSKLINDLMNGLNLGMLSDSMSNKAEGTEDLNPCSPKSFGTDMYDTLDTLDILLSEHQLEEALVVLEVETKTLQTMHKEDLLSPMIMSYMSAISDRRDRLANQFACLAEHSWVSQPEMQKALCALCRLGENQRAILGLKFWAIPGRRETFARFSKQALSTRISEQRGWRELAVLGDKINKFKEAH